MCHCTSPFLADKPVTSPMHSLCSTVSTSRLKGPAAQAMPHAGGRQGLRLRCSTAVLRPVSHAAGDSFPSHEAQAQTWIATPARQAKVQRTKHHRAAVWLVEGVPSLGNPLRQARAKLRRHGHAGLLAAVSATLLFVQNLIANRKQSLVIM